MLLQKKPAGFTPREYPGSSPTVQTSPSLSCSLCPWGGKKLLMHNSMLGASAGWGARGSLSLTLQYKAGLHWYVSCGGNVGVRRRCSQRKSEGAFRGANPHLARHSWKVLSPLGFQFSIRSLFRALSKGGITSSAVVVFSLGYMQIYFLRNMLAALKKSISRSSNSVFSKTA